MPGWPLQRCPKGAQREDRLTDRRVRWGAWGAGVLEVLLCSLRGGFWSPQRCRSVLSLPQGSGEKSGGAGVAGGGRRNLGVANKRPAAAALTINTVSVAGPELSCLAFCIPVALCLSFPSRPPHPPAATAAARSSLCPTTG